MVKYERDYEVSRPILIWGESEFAYRVAVELSRYLLVILAFSGETERQAEGISIISNSRLRKVEGTSGNFTVEIETDGYLTRQIVGTIIVFPEPEHNVVADLKAVGSAERSLSLVAVLEKIRPGVFREVLKEALAMTSRGHHVFLVVDEVQVNFADGEKLYQEARQAGVIFFKDAVISLPDGTGEGTCSQNQIRSSGPQTVCVHTSTLDGTEPLIIEADCVWWHSSDRPRRDYLEVLEMLGVCSNIQEYYPFRTRRKGILVVDQGWGEPFGEEEIITSLKILVSLSDKGVVCNYEVRPDLCALCFTCYRTCPHQAVILGQPAQNLYGQAMLIEPKACFNCGRCEAECPARAIRKISSQDIAANKLVLACENSGGFLLQESDIPYSLFPCAGSIGVIDILRAWEPNINQLVILTCRDGKCQHGSGGKRLSSRVDRLNEFLKSLSVPVDIKVLQVSAQDRMDEIRRRVTQA